MSDYTGVVIEESLEDTAVLDGMSIVSTEVEPVTESHQTPWLPQWTLHTVEIPEERAAEIAKLLGESLDRSHAGAWYADFKNDTHHYIIFADKIFHIDRSSKQEYDEAKAYGISVGIPEQQVDFHPEVEEWERPPS